MVANTGSELLSRVKGRLLSNPVDGNNFIHRFWTFGQMDFFGDLALNQLENPILAVVIIILVIMNEITILKCKFIQKVVI